jgi:hypothetical protein
MNSTRQILGCLFFAIGIAHGVYQYAGKGIYHANSQWDLWNYITSVNKPIPLATEANQDRLFNPYVPCLPTMLLLSNWLGRFNWHVVRAVWLLGLCLCLGILIYWKVREIARHDQFLQARQKWFLVFAVILYKGTYLALASGNPALLVTFLLIVFDYEKEQKPWLAILCLALAATKIHLALPFYIYLLIKGDYRHFVLTVTVAAAINLLASLLYFNSWEQMKFLFEALIQFEQQPSNDPAFMARTGRVDLAPFAAVFGITGVFLKALLTSIGVGGLLLIYVYRNRMDDRVLLFNVNLVFFVALYHRDYDLVLLLILALPFIWAWRNEFTWLHILALFPVVLPIQRMHEMGIKLFPPGEFIFNLIGASMVISIGVIGLVVNRKVFASSQPV